MTQVYGDKDGDGFYLGEAGGQRGFVPCNMVSELQVEEQAVLQEILRRGFLPPDAPLDQIGGETPAGVTARRMIALFDYDPRESSPNVDIEAELSFTAGDIIAIYGDMDEDGFYFGELNSQTGLVPSNFLEEVPGDLEVALSIPDEREADGEQQSSPATSGGGSPKTHGSSSSPASSLEGSPRKKKGFFSKGKYLLKKLGPSKK
uniref:SH3 domain-containing protein n=1 Tax=Petromyzon marinus TaxID=7757 RepID=S4RCH7_PETMA